MNFILDNKVMDGNNPKANVKINPGKSLEILSLNIFYFI